MNRPDRSVEGSDPAVFFLSDYGMADEFVGVVHAVLHRLAPSVPVIDLSHLVPAFDIAAGAALLVRSGPHLGPGVVLAVVDPGVGTDRRGVAIEVSSDGPAWLVGPDNGLLGPLALALGGARSTVALDPVLPAGQAGASHPRTFDGRDVFAPAAAHLVTGGAPLGIGTPVDPATLVGAPPVGRGAPQGLAGARRGPGVEATVAWVDHFGNAELDVVAGDLAATGLVPGATARITVAPGAPAPADPVPSAGAGGRTLTGRWVHTFGQLRPGELGLLVDANGQVALVLDRASAAQVLHVTGPGAVMRIAPSPEDDDRP